MSRDNLEKTGDKSGLHGSRRPPTRQGVRGLHTTWDNIPSDMCFPFRGTHITKDTFKKKCKWGLFSGHTGSFYQSILWVYSNPPTQNDVGATSEYPATNFPIKCTATAVHSPQSVERNFVCKCIATVVHSLVVRVSEFESDWVCKCCATTVRSPVVGEFEIN